MVAQSLLSPEHLENLATQGPASPDSNTQAGPGSMCTLRGVMPSPLSTVAQD